MQVVSVNVALPQTIEIRGEPVLTGIYKQPVQGPRHAGKLTLEGDGQADLSVHGGEYQALYGYPLEHYAHWEQWTGRAPFPYGTFGENLTTTGLLETTVFIGDRYRMGGALLEVTSPRLPCFKFAHKMGRPDILKPFLHSGHSGFYFRVIEEGPITAGDSIALVSRPAESITMRTLLGLLRLHEGDHPTLQRAARLPALPPHLREEFQKRLAAAG